MKNIIKSIFKHFLLFAIGGAVYILMEIAYRGYSHWTMFILGGICFVLLGGINNWISWDMPLWLQCIIGTIVTTSAEFIAGVILNIWLGMGIWDYSNTPMNIMGQICVPFMFIWFGVSAIAITLDDHLRYWIFGEEKPHYVMWFK